MTRYNSDLTTVEAVVRLLDKADPGTTPTALNNEYDDFYALLKNDLIPMTSAYIQQYCNRAFVPYVETKHYYHRDMWRNNTWQNYQLLLDDDLLVTTGITWNGTVLSASAWRELDPRSHPHYAIEFDEDNTAIELDTDTFDNKTSVAGIWGYHTNISQMYRAADSSVTINSSATTLSVTDASIYETLQYIKVQSEWMQITARNETTDVLTVRRAVNGSTAASHTTQAVSIFNPVDDIRQAATRLAAWSYQHRNDLGDRIQFADGTTVITAMPAFVREVLSNKRRIIFPLPER
jgi:hypothetical protein